MDKLISKEDYNITKDIIPYDLNRRYFNMFSKKQRTMILLHYKSIEDYLCILYYFKFIKKLSNSEMAEITGKASFYQVYYKLGWHYPIYSLEEIEAHHQKELNKLILLKEKAIHINEHELPDDFLSFYKSNENQISNLVSNSGITDKKTYLKVIYYLFKIEKLSIPEIAYIFNNSPSTLNKRFKRFGLLRDRYEAQQLVAQKGKRDYSSIHKAGSKTRLKSVLKTGLNGSPLENNCRTIMEIMLPNFFNLQLYEIIIGINCRSIIYPYELDIPFIIINKDTQKITKIAIEFNGDFFHSSEGTKQKDEMKTQEFQKQGWYCFTITAFSSTRRQKEYGLFEDQIREIYNNILLII